MSVLISVHPRVSLNILSLFDNLKIFNCSNFIQSDIDKSGLKPSNSIVSSLSKATLRNLDFMRHRTETDPFNANLKQLYGKSPVKPY